MLDVMLITCLEPMLPNILDELAQMYNGSDKSEATAESLISVNNSQSALKYVFALVVILVVNFVVALSLLVNSDMFMIQKACLSCWYYSGNKTRSGSHFKYHCGMYGGWARI